MTKTLQDYIGFLRKHGFVHEALLFENDVVALLKVYGYENPLELPADEALAKLYEMHDTLAAGWESINKAMNKWDVELHDAR